MKLVKNKNKELLLKTTHSIVQQARANQRAEDKHRYQHVNTTRSRRKFLQKPSNRLFRPPKFPRSHCIPPAATAATAVLSHRRYPVFPIIPLCKFPTSNFSKSCQDIKNHLDFSTGYFELLRFLSSKCFFF